MGVGEASVAEIDRLNILHATMLAMQRAVAALPEPPDHLRSWTAIASPRFACAATAVVGGDGRCLSVAAASIIAKVTRDRTMTALDREFPGYGWERNAGYGTRRASRRPQALGAYAASPLVFRAGCAA